jgi:hypothetical protein
MSINEMLNELPQNIDTDKVIKSFANKKCRKKCYYKVIFKKHAIQMYYGSLILNIFGVK